MLQAASPASSSVTSLLLPRRSTATATPDKKKARVVVDGNYAAAHAAYAMSDCSFVYPITPSSGMSHQMEEWAARGKPNLISGSPVVVKQMQSEAGVAGAVHGALQSGALCSTFTSSQGLLLMIPNLYKIAGEALPMVLHLAARAVSANGVTIFSDHSDVSAIKQTGVALLSSHSVQEAADLAIVSHIAALNSSTPFVHFFEGMEVSHEAASCDLLPYEELAQLIPVESLRKFRFRSLNPRAPTSIGVVLGRETFWQHSEADIPRYNQVPKRVEEAMEKLGKITGRKRGLFEYVGAPDADRVVVVMGDGAQTVQLAVNRLCAAGQKVGVLKVHLYRPWAADRFLLGLPRSARKVAVLDRVSEPTASGEPLFLDVAASIQDRKLDKFIGGRYGIGGHDFTVEMAESVFAELNAADPRHRFSVGIVDDVTHNSLPLPTVTATTPSGERPIQCMFWGIGGDGTVSANRSAAGIVGDKFPDVGVQAIFQFDAHKTGGVTVSHLRFSKTNDDKEQTAPWFHGSIGTAEADFVACHVANYLNTYDVVGPLRPEGSLLLNTKASNLEEIEQTVPARVRRELAQKQARLFVVDASGLARKAGLGKHTSTVLSAAFFKLSGVGGTASDAAELLKKAAAATYGKTGAEDKSALTAKNASAIDLGMSELVEIKYPATWATLPDETAAVSQGEDEPGHIKEIVRPLQKLQGMELPVSAFATYGAHGSTPCGTAAYEKRGLATEIPTWIPSKCIQCNKCSMVCPHSAIRPWLIPKSDGSSSVQTIPAFGDKQTGYRIQVSPLDCTGCNACAASCPTKALKMDPWDDKEVGNWKKFASVPGKTMTAGTPINVKTSQLSQPLLEFSAACSGCPEPVYSKLLTQLVGDRLVIANGIGCSTVWGGTGYFNPYTSNGEGKGPAWGCSLFEDTAEYGLGIATGYTTRRAAYHKMMVEAAKDERLDQELRDTMSKWVETWQKTDAEAHATSDKLHKLLHQKPEEYRRKDPSARQVLIKLRDQSDLLTKRSNWIVGGDGWAYDIGFGGIDHLLAGTDPVRILVLNNELYANTGGQASKASPAAAVLKLATQGKKAQKKDLGLYALATHPKAYVATVCYGANAEQTLKALKEAEEHPGPSIVVAYCPCHEHSLKGGFEGKNIIERMQTAVSSGYWPLYRRNPTVAGGKLVMDSTLPEAETAKKFMEGEGRFTAMTRSAPDASNQLQDATVNSAAWRNHLLQLLRQ